MALAFHLSWVIGEGGGALGGNKTAESWPEVEALLERAGRAGGAVTLDRLGDSSRPKSLQVRIDAGRFVLTLGVESDDDYEVRTLTTSSSHDLAELAGEQFPEAAISTDRPVMLDVFRRFYLSGDVPLDILS